MYEVYADMFKDGKGALVKIGEAETKRGAAYIRRMASERTVIYKDGQFLNAVGMVRKG